MNSFWSWTLRQHFSYAAACSVAVYCQCTLRRKCVCCGYHRFHDDSSLFYNFCRVNAGMIWRYGWSPFGYSATRWWCLCSNGTSAVIIMPVQTASDSLAAFPACFMLHPFLWRLFPQPAGGMPMEFYRLWESGKGFLARDCQCSCCICSDDRLFHDYLLSSFASSSLCFLDNLSEAEWTDKRWIRKFVRLLAFLPLAVILLYLIWPRCDAGWYRFSMLSRWVISSIRAFAEIRHPQVQLNPSRKRIWNKISREPRNFPPIRRNYAHTLKVQEYLQSTQASQSQSESPRCRRCNRHQL